MKEMKKSKADVEERISKMASKLEELTANNISEKADTAQLIEEVAIKTLGELPANFSRVETDIALLREEGAVTIKTVGELTANYSRVVADIIQLQGAGALLPKAIQIIGDDRNSLADVINSVSERVKNIEEALRLLGQEGDSLKEIGDTEVHDFIVMAKQVVLKQYCFQSEHDEVIR